MVHMPAKYVAELTAIRDSLEEIRREAAEGVHDAIRLENIHDARRVE